MGFELSWAWAWLFVAAALVVGEIFTAGFFLLPFGIGAAAASFTAWMGGSPVLQWVAFVGVSVAVLVPLQRFATRVTQGGPDLKIAADRMLGRIGEVLETVPPHGVTGRVRIGSEEWRATSHDEQRIEPGTPIEVLRVDGTHLVVKPREGQPAGTKDGGVR